MIKEDVKNNGDISPNERPNGREISEAKEIVINAKHGS